MFYKMGLGKALFLNAASAAAEGRKPLFNAERERRHFMKLENRLYALELDIDMISFKIDLIIEDLEEELDLIKEQEKDPDKTIHALAVLETAKKSLIKLAARNIQDLRLKNE